MYQPEVKLRFVERYCHPTNGWEVFVDLDASELGNTGGPRQSVAAEARQQEMQRSGQRVKGRFQEIGVQVGGSRAGWIRALSKKHSGETFPEIPGDRDILAIHPIHRKLIVAEAEGDSSGQPEQKLYKAIGQIVVATGEVLPRGYEIKFLLVFSGERLKDHAKRAKALERLGVSALYIADGSENWEPVFGSPPT